MLCSTCMLAPKLQALVYCPQTRSLPFLVTFFAFLCYPCKGFIVTKFSSFHAFNQFMIQIGKNRNHYKIFMGCTKHTYFKVYYNHNIFKIASILMIDVVQS